MHVSCHSLVNESEAWDNDRQASNLSRGATHSHEWELNPQPSSYKAELFAVSHWSFENGTRSNGSMTIYRLFCRCLIMFFFTQYCVSVSCDDDLRRPRSSSFASITKSAARISQERFYLELANFIWPSIPTYTTATPDMTSSTTSGRDFSKF